MSEELRERLAEATSAHHIDPNWSDADRHSRCVCGGWADGEMEPGWDDHMADISAAVFAAWLRERVAAELAEPSDRVGRCRCGRSTVTSERSGRITALGMVADEIAPQSARARADASLAPALAAQEERHG